MPDGRVVRIDEERKCAYLVRGGRLYEAPLSEVEAAARVPSVRVHFNVTRSDGVESAEEVTLRRGTRSNRRQRRFGDLTGARQPGSKTRTGPQREYGIDVTTQPVRVAQAWIAAVTAGDVDSASSFYIPGAVVHTAEGPVAGHSRIRRLLEYSPWLGLKPDESDLHGVDRYVEATHPNTPGVTTFLIEAGLLAEQWLNVAPPTEEPSEEAETGAKVLQKGQVPEPAVDYAQHRADHFRDAVGRPVRDFLIKLTQAANPSTEHPALVEASADINGTFLRSHVAADTMNEGIDRALARLRSKLEHHPDSRIPRRGSGQEATSAGDGPPVGGHTVLPPHQREIVRHKSFAPGEMTVDEAAWDMDQMDYAFFLFPELGTGIDCLLIKDEDGTFHLQGVEDPTAATEGAAIEVTVDGIRPPKLTLKDAVEFLDTAKSDRLFFVNTATDRGNALYRRFDGHYGLITPPLRN